VSFRDAKEATQNENKVRRIEVYVNGFQARPPKVELAAKLSASGPSSAPFATELILNQKENTIQVECADLPVEAGRKQEFTVVCKKPQTPAKLHLLIVGVDVRGDEAQKALVEHAKRALQVNPAGQGLRSLVFNEVITHPVSLAPPARDSK